MGSKVEVRFEQAVYGTFPFWDRGYDILAQSGGCQPEWLADLKVVCQRYGERPLGASGAGGLFATRLATGPWVVVGVSDQGVDDHGRPGARAFHALFLSPTEYRKADCCPFRLAGALRKDWGPETTTLPGGIWRVGPPGPSPEDEQAVRIAEALARGRRVAVESAGPIDSLAEAVWRALPGRARRRASVATWAFSNGNRFDLVALPRIAGAELDATYIETTEFEYGSAGRFKTAEFLLPPPPSRFPLPVRRALPWGIAAFVLVAALVAGATIAPALKSGGVGPPAAPAPTPTPSPAFDTDYPDPAAYRGRSIDPAEESRVAEGLVDLAERLGVAGSGESNARPVVLMVRLADEVRYRGPVLSPADLNRLKSEPSPERDRAISWHALIRRFLPDRPLPPGFARGPLPWQLDTLAWSFHLDPDPRRSAPEVPHALAHELSVDGSVRPSPLASRYPALEEYAEFLDRLPRR
jgi:hypothetical protein